MAGGAREVVQRVVDGVSVEVRRSGRRRRTVSAYRQEGRLVVLVPARMSRSEEDEWVRAMVARVEASEARRPRSDTDLQRRATELSRQYLSGRARPASVRWVTNQRTRWGSCTPADGTIRLSAQLRDMPGWVRDYVLLHELAHLLETGHGVEFWGLLAGYPRLERARGYLQGVAATARLEITDDDPDTDPDPDPDAADVEATLEACTPSKGVPPTVSV
ncbi:M48 family metallopeptidase [Humibacillus sp. DSM 29435]|uniref:M48 metallopeptidase family protein n=1 Tax=Humibacillus sp. DSM 29435 TaxID=1869167 RepID=UPI0009F4517A|nr:M48 family metallopeptidase [Humibacillus sp. DSM 29435]